MDNAEMAGKNNRFIVLTFQQRYKTLIIPAKIIVFLIEYQDRDEVIICLDVQQSEKARH